MPEYIALLRKEADSDFSVDFPDFPGCVTAGRSLEEAKDMAAEALALLVAGLQKDKERIPPPSSLDDVMADPHNRGTVAFLVPAKTRKEKSVRVNVTIQETLLAEIDRAAAKRNLSRSAFLQDGAARLIGNEQDRPGRRRLLESRGSDQGTLGWPCGADSACRRRRR